ncbi:hypothetical protein LCGC14_0652010 [marine sediment metagenome]|uniref:Uncharacterized protein n=1 Tax=marine sediment metagenome TaxID=412755 RepID=A0A0F9U4E5_9ZZZZ
MIHKKSFLTRDFVVAGILFSGLLALFVLAIAGISDQYDTAILTNDDFAENYDRLIEQTNRVETARETAAAGEGLSFIGTFDVAFQSTFTVIQMVFQTLDIFGDITGSFAEDFGVDPTVTRIIFLIGLAILTTLIVWTWISSISRGKI